MMPLGRNDGIITRPQTAWRGRIRRIQGRKTNQFGKVADASFIVIASPARGEAIHIASGKVDRHAPPVNP
jgi:hypothetical protein